MIHVTEINNINELNNTTETNETNEIIELDNIHEIDNNILLKETKETKSINKKATPLDEYILFLNDKCERCMKTYKHKQKSIPSLKIEEGVVPQFSNYSEILNNKYNVQQLKSFAKTYKLKLSGNKNELLFRLFSHLKLSYHALKIQQLFRGELQRRYNFLHGPAFLKRELCNNPCDFLTMESMKDIPVHQFFSYMDQDGFVYGFDILSLYNLITKSGKDAKNPYNRNDIPLEAKHFIKLLLRLSRILKVDINVDIKDIELDISTEKSLELRILDLFQNINALGNYSDSAWFLSLNRNQLLKFMRELSDIWNYRAQILTPIKRNISPPYGNPFMNLSMNHIQQETNVQSIQRIILPILEKFVNSGIDKDSKSLGAYYVLGALTLVNENAATSLPWLFQSVSYF